MKGSIYLLPVTLGGKDYSQVIPAKVIEITKKLRLFIVEDIRSARRYLRLIDKAFPIDDTTFLELNEHTPDREVSALLEPVIRGSDCGLMSEAGLPGIADPGTRVVALAHRKNITVIPMSGPSSIILALISSGFTGQHFTFNGYLPVKPVERAARIRELEKKAGEGYTQIFMETPYRAGKMADAILAVCNKETQLCIASDISLETESVRTMKIEEWQRNPPKIKDRLVVFLLK